MMVTLAFGLEKRPTTNPNVSNYGSGAPKEEIIFAGTEIFLINLFHKGSYKNILYQFYYKRF